MIISSITILASSPGAKTYHPNVRLLPSGIEPLKASEQLSGVSFLTSITAFAYNAGNPGSTAICGCSDDGEPHGTAGRPMLNVVLHSDVGELCVVVTRYFGGILLGTGGLVKAYQDSVKLALEDLPLTVRMIPAFITACFEHRYITVFLRLLPNFRAEIIDSNFADKAFYHVRLPQSEVENFHQKLIEMTKGQVDFAEVKN